MTTEAELVLMSLTDEELEDAARYLDLMHDRWRESRRVAEAEGRDRLTEIGFHGTEGPVHALRALDLAIVRERAQRGGAEPWYSPMSTDGHPGALRIRYYQERIALNPDQGGKPRLSAAGILERVCPGCGESKPLTVAFWEWLGAGLALHCRACRHAPTPARRELNASLRAALIDAQEAAVPPAEPVEPFAPEELGLDEPAQAGWAL